MRCTRRNFFRSTAGGLLVGGGALLLPRRLKADDMPATVEDALGVFINVWNQFGPNDSPGFGVNWTSDPASASLVSAAFDALTNSWAADGSDFEVQNVLDSGTFSRQLMDFQVAARAFEQMVQRGAKVQLSDVRNWLTDPNVDWDSAILQLLSTPLSALTQSLGWALSDPQESGGDIGALGPAVAVGAGMADVELLGSDGASPTSAAGALALQLANMAMVPASFLSF